MLFTVSYVYYTTIGMVIVLVIGMIVSCLTGLNDPSEMDKDLFSPLIHRFLKPKKTDKFKQKEVRFLNKKDKLQKPRDFRFSLLH